ncbi:oocyte zinc finger protein XlCOF6 [Stomoxys calcitrans]|uniref:oocyte zinc finger protein XlCOF6 n=1 Tax=Stomoxys calcitrans TaxID=35570 RepID=UPI0027E2DAFF|nr:oocyte zinc finger protein XlCOF6 [Stomoxys calcitrans]
METCRTCAKCDFDNPTQWLDLFNAQHWKPETERIHIELNTWKIKVSCNDGLPQKICTDCFSKFCTVSQFRLQCMEAQQILSNIFDKIDTQSIQEDNEVFEGFEQSSNGRDNDLAGNTTTALASHTAPTSHNDVVIIATEAAVANVVSPPEPPKKPIESILPKRNSKNDDPDASNGILHLDEERDNTEVSFKTMPNVNINDTAVLENRIEKTTFGEPNNFLSDSNDTSITNNELLPEDTNDLDENDLIEELIDELDIIEEADENYIENEDNQDQNQNNIYPNLEQTFQIPPNDNDNNEHNKIVSDNNLKISFECKYCYKWKNSGSENFHTQQELLAHITELHSSELPYNCPYCRVSFMDAASRTTHLKEVHSQKLYSCDTCGKKYADKFNLRNHVEKYHSGADFDCTLCAKSFCSSKSLNYHMKWHNPKEQLKCSYCDRLFINQRHLKVHEETHTGFRSQEVCSFCGKYFFHLKTLRWHIFRQHGGEKPYKCGRCTEVFTSYFEKRLHMLEYHLDNLTLIEKTECMLCHKRYENEHILKDHMLEDHKENKGAVKIANNKRVIMNKKPKSFTGLFQCEKCDKRFNMKSALERHMAVHSTEGRPHACPQCPKRFKRSQDMKWHLKTHSSEKPNICDICGKGFALKYVLTQHRRSHEVLEKNFTCSTCGRSYLFEKSLRLHERIHSGKTYYKCDLCSESFVTHIKFKWHMKKMHDEEDVAATNFNPHSNNNNTELPLDNLVNIVIT